ncbi:MAG: hypothetical protein ABIH41_06120 [Nanoarchaeota archaeon]
MVGLLFVVLVQSVFAAPCRVLDTVTGDVLDDADCDGWPDGLFDGSYHPALIVAPAQPMQVDYVNTIDIAQGGLGEFFVVKIHNPNLFDVKLDLSIDGVSGWGSYMVQPSALVVPSQQTQQVHLFVSAEYGAALGDHRISMTITPRSSAFDEPMRLSLVARVHEAGRPSAGGVSALEVSLIVLIGILLIVGLIIGYERMRKEELR